MLLPTPLLPLLLFLATPTTAHFRLTYPAARGFSTQSASVFPCGGFDTPSTTRTPWPINGGPVQLRMDHTQNRIQVLLALGDNPGESFNVVLRQTFEQEGLGDFCVGALNVPEGVNVEEGMRATVQVVSNGHEGGGLYQCADVILTNTPLPESEYSSNCKNGTSRIVQENIAGSPNGTTGGGEQPSSTEGGQPPASASPTGGAGTYLAGTWVMGVVGAVAFAVL